MQRFRFPLEKVRAWRNTQAELEHVQLEKLVAGLDHLRSVLAGLDAGKSAEEQAVLHLGAVEAQQLTSLDVYRRHVESEKAKMRKHIAESEHQVAAQRTRLMEARRNLQLLDKLKQRRQAEWQLEFAHEEESLASELFLARWQASTK